jgi:hypothetical protein
MSTDASQQKAPAFVIETTLCGTEDGGTVWRATTRWQGPPVLRLSDDGTRSLFVGIPEGASRSVALVRSGSAEGSQWQGDADDAVFSRDGSRIVILLGGRLQRIVLADK